MRLGSVYIGSQQWVIGELLAGLPPPLAKREDEDEEPPAEAIRLRDAMIVIPIPVPVETPNLIGAEPQLGLMGGDLLIVSPLPTELNIEYGDTAPPWQVMTIDESNPPARGVVKRYLELAGRWRAATVSADGDPAAREVKRTLRTS